MGRGGEGKGTKGEGRKGHPRFLPGLTPVSGCKSLRTVAVNAFIIYPNNGLVFQRFTTVSSTFI